MNRLISGLTAAAMLTVTPVAVSGSVAAAPATLADAATAAPATDARMAKIERTLNAEIVSSSKRIVKGKVKPKPNKRLTIIVKRAKKADGKYKKVRTFKTKANGKWRVRFARERGYIMLLLKGNKKYTKAVERFVISS